MNNYVILFFAIFGKTESFKPRLYRDNTIYSAKKITEYEDFFNEYEDIEDFYTKTQKPNTFKNIFNPRSETQELYNHHIKDNDLKIVIASGPAGTGKTLFPTQYAAKLLEETDTKIVLTRPLISVDEELGYLPGNINQKMDPWIIPIFDVLREFYTQQTINKFILEKRIEIVPLAFMRGRTFKNTFIIGDELQNTSIKQMLMLLTRLGENSKLIITGDIHQCDNDENGLLDLLSKIKNKYINNELLEEKQISVIEFNEGDIQRSPIIETILNLYDN